MNSLKNDKRLACRLFGRGRSNVGALRKYSKSKVSQLQGVLDAFHSPIRYAVAYGSGALPQNGYSKDAKKDAMVDFIFGVSHPAHWHSLNLRQNPSHYSSMMKGLGVGAIVNVQERFGAKIYYNIPSETVNGMKIKYGVVAMHHLQRDLEEWETLYLAGRLHKPVQILREDAKLGIASKKNLENATRAALLMLPERFSAEDLYIKIAGLSYSGDFRMRLGENPHKVFNIVYAQMDAFNEKYDGVISDLPNVNKLADGSLEQDLSLKLRGSMIQALPVNMKEKMKSNYLWSISKEGKTSISADEREEPAFSQAMGQYQNMESVVRKSVRDIVALPALTQSIKGIVSVGLVKSTSYALGKLKKQFLASK